MTGLNFVPFAEAFPGAVLAIGPDDQVLWLNTTAREVCGSAEARPFPDLLDAASGSKWAELKTQLTGGASSLESELVLNAPPRLPQPLRCSILHSDGVWWITEHPGAAGSLRHDEDLLAVNSELASTQRDLRRERIELARTLDALRARTAELERVNRALDDFAHVVSHDLRAPLRAIAQFSEWLEADLAGRLAPEPAEHLRMLRDRVGVLHRMVTGILEVARAGRADLQEQAMDPAVVIAEAVSLLGLPDTVSVEVQAPLPTVQANPTAMTQVWLNLIANAARYGGAEDGSVRIIIGCSSEGGVVTFWVEDRGPGVPPAMTERIWLPFHTGSTEKGTGIGLPVVRRIVEGRGGAVRYLPAEPQGARFEFDWPIEATE